MRTSRVVFFDILKYLRFNAANLFIAQCPNGVRHITLSLSLLSLLTLEMSLMPSFICEITMMEQANERSALSSS